jgi:hypothetical protein
MRKIILCTMLMLLATVTFSQQTNPSVALTKQDYLKKSKKQKTAAWLLLSGGLACVITGSILSTDLSVDDDNYGSLFDENTSRAGTVVAIIGSCFMAGSIPFFIAAHRNKKKSISLSFKNEMAPQIQKWSFVYRSVPSITLKISL